MEMLSQSPYEHNVVVTHGKILRILFAVMLLGNAVSPELISRINEFLYTTNTGVSIVEYKDGKWELITWNDFAHLNEIVEE